MFTIFLVIRIKSVHMTVQMKMITFINNFALLNVHKILHIHITHLNLNIAIINVILD